MGVEGAPGGAFEGFLPPRFFGLGSSAGPSAVATETVVDDVESPELWALHQAAGESLRQVVTPNLPL